MLAQHLAVVRGVDDEPVVQVLAVVLQPRQQPAILVVDVLDHAVVRRGRPAQVADVAVDAGADLALAQEWVVGDWLVEVRLDAVEVVAEPLGVDLVGIVGGDQAEQQHQRPLRLLAVVLRR